MIKCIKVLDQIQILPFEHAYGARVVYDQSHLLLALDLIKGKKYSKAQTILQKVFGMA